MLGHRYNKITARSIYIWHHSIICVVYCLDPRNGQLMKKIKGKKKERKEKADSWFMSKVISNQDGITNTIIYIQEQP